MASGSLSEALVFAEVEKLIEDVVGRQGLTFLSFDLVRASSYDRLRSLAIKGLQQEVRE